MKKHHGTRERVRLAVFAPTSDDKAGPPSGRHVVGAPAKRQRGQQQEELLRLRKEVAALRAALAPRVPASRIAAEGTANVPARGAAAATGGRRVVGAPAKGQRGQQRASKGAASGGTKSEYTWAPGRVARTQHAELASAFKPSPNFYAPLRGLGTEPDVPPPVPPPKAALYSQQQVGMEAKRVKS